MYLSVLDWTEEKRIAKFAEFETEEEAQTHVLTHRENWPQAFVAERPEASFQDWIIVRDEQTISIVPRPGSEEDFKSAIRAHLDTAARERNYDGALSIATYITSLRPEWAAEARAFIKWRDDVWAYTISELEKIQRGEREIPKVEEFIAELPKIQWPNAIPENKKGT